MKRRYWRRRRIGNAYESTLIEEGADKVIAIAGVPSFHDHDPELRLVCDPRTGKPWESTKAVVQWLNGALKHRDLAARRRP